MHELSIAQELIEIVEEAAREAGALRVEIVHLRLGRLSGVVADALLFAFDVATEGTLLDGATLAIEDVPVLVYCESCAANRVLEDIRCFRCPVCDCPTGQVVQGRELEVRSVEIVEHPSVTACQPGATAGP